MKVPARSEVARWFASFAVLTAFALTVHGLVFVLDAHVASWGAAAFAVGVHAVYSGAFAAAGLAPAALLAWVLCRRVAPHGTVPGRAAVAAVGAVAVLGTASAHVVVAADGFVRRTWGFHLNGMIWDLVTTPGGVESLGAGASTHWTVAAVAAGFVALQTVLLVAAQRTAWGRAVGDRVLPPAGLRVRGAAAAALVAATALASGLSEVALYRPVTAVGAAYPFFPRFRLSSLARILGLRAAADTDGGIGDADAGRGAGALAYPLAPLRRRAGAPSPNVVFLVCESLRADALDAEIMPRTHEFAAGGRRFDRHFSAGNGTQMGVFGLFYGLHGAYWDPFLSAARGPVLLDAMRDAGYDLEAFTSARFTYPQFDRTVFAQVPRDRLHERDPDLPGWKNDQRNVTKLLASIDRVPAGTPFFRFAFLESPHAPYRFPPESAVRMDFATDLNYVAMDLSDPGEVRRIFNRYVNACHHLDGQLGRVFDGLRERGLLDSTIVLVAGDHGEEFMEHGHWGHHSAVTDAQTRTPFVLRGPGVPPGVETAMTSHLDAAPTLLRLLGVENPPSDFTFGADLVEGPRRDRTVVSGFDDIAVVDDRLKIVHGFRGAGSLRERATTADDRPCGDGPEVSAARAAQVRVLLEESRRFIAR